MGGIKVFLLQRVDVPTRREKFWFAVFVGLFCFLFLLFFQPFGVNNYDPSERINPLFFLMMFLMAGV